jgi:hypothetical protein
MVFCSSTSSGRRAHLEQGGDLEQLGQQPAHRHLAGVATEHRLADRAQGLGEGVDVVMGRHIAGVEMDRATRA